MFRKNTFAAYFLIDLKEYSDSVVTPTAAHHAEMDSVIEQNTFKINTEL